VREQDGFDDLETVKLITDDEMRQLGIVKTGHRKRVLYWIECQRNGTGSGIMRDTDSERDDSRGDVATDSDKDSADGGNKDANDSSKAKRKSEKKKKNTDKKDKDSSSNNNSGPKAVLSPRVNSEPTMSIATVSSEPAVVVDKVQPLPPSSPFDAQRIAPASSLFMSGSSIPIASSGKKSTPSKPPKDFECTFSLIMAHRVRLLCHHRRRCRRVSC
jgi:hypothetical protein